MPEKQRLFVDMDGTIAEFRPVDTLETLYEKGYFLNLKPMDTVIQAVRDIIKQNPDIEVNILSAVLADSPYALEEKNAWLDRYLPEIDEKHRVFPPCGGDKKEYIPGGIRPTDCLLDDYTHNLIQWQPPARGIKLLNNINHTRGTWTHDRIRHDKRPDELARDIVNVVKGTEQIRDEKPAFPERMESRVNDLTEDIKDILANFQHDPDLFTDFMAFKAQFHDMSVRNSILIQQQHPHATFTATFKQWEALGYRVKKGEKHIRVLRPVESVRFERKGELLSVKYATNEEKAKIHSREIKTVRNVNFIPYCVFDISQTNCPKEDYPKIYSMGYESVEHADLYRNIKEYAQSCGFTVQEDDLKSIALHGFYRRDTDEIIINSALNDTKKLSVMCHELAHGVLHKTSTLSVPEKEFEAECFAVMLQRKFGFPVEDASKGYIKQYYAKLDKNKPFDPEESLSRLGKVLHHVGGGIDKTLEGNGYTIGKERHFNQEEAQSRTGKGVEAAKNIAENFLHNL